MKYIKYIALAGLVGLTSSCIDDLLNRPATTEVSSDLFWTSTDDALSSTYGVYNAVRTLFATDYYYDGHGEFQNTRGKSIGDISSWGPGTPGSGFSSMWNNAYRVINRANYTIQYVEQMIQAEQNAVTKASLEAINAENYFLRALAYFRLVQNWGDVPYYRHVLSGNDEACSLVRTPIATIIPELITDLQNASEKLPVSYGDKYGRATQVAALGFKAKIELYYACWNKNGWPELEGFEPSSSVAQTYYAAAASDFSKVINNYGLTIFGDGNPGTEDKPNYRELFQYYNENCSEIIFSITYGGPSLGQGESLLRDFGTRTTGNAQCWIMPTVRLANRYQSTVTGDFCDELILSKDATLPNGARNRASYENRDWRMKSTIMWDGESYKKITTDGLTMGDEYTWMFGERNEANGFINNDASNQTGYIFRKFMDESDNINYVDIESTSYWIEMRYAEIVLILSEAYARLDKFKEAYDYLNKIRTRVGLPILAQQSTWDNYLEDLSKERVCELGLEGHRWYDLVRWDIAQKVLNGQRLHGIKIEKTGSSFLYTRVECDTQDRKFPKKYNIFPIPSSELRNNIMCEQTPSWK